MESYAIRHLGAQAIENGDPEGIRQLRRSYRLRAALGARPQTAAAAVTVASYLPAGPEADELAHDLRLSWPME